MATLPILTDTAAWTDSDLEALRIAVVTEQEQRRNLVTSVAQIENASWSYRIAADRALPKGTKPAYKVGEPYPVGYVFSYEGKTYKVRQTHITQADWKPDAVLALYEVVPDAPAGGGTPAWQASVSYKVNDTVTYQSKTYKCLQAHTSQVGWEPAAVPALWSLV